MMAADSQCLPCAGHYPARFRQDQSGACGAWHRVIKSACFEWHAPPHTTASQTAPPRTTASQNGFPPSLKPLISHSLSRRELLSQLNSDIDALEANVTPTWAGLVEPIERIFDRLERAWGAVSHLKACCTSMAARVMQMRDMSSMTSVKQPCVQRTAVGTCR